METKTTKVSWGTLREFFNQSNTSVKTFFSYSPTWIPQDTLVFPFLCLRPHTCAIDFDPVWILQQQRHWKGITDEIIIPSWRRADVQKNYKCQDDLRTLASNTNTHTNTNTKAKHRMERGSCATSYKHQVIQINVTFWQIQKLLRGNYIRWHFILLFCYFCMLISLLYSYLKWWC